MKRALILVVALAIPTAAAGHHGWSSYDTEQVLRLDARFTSVSWSNPHGHATMTYRGKQWHVVLAPVARMEARGLTPAMIAPGKRVQLVGYPRKDGTSEMRIERIAVEGKTVELR